MGAYIIAIVGATIVASVISVLTPDKWDKYVGLVTGIVITLCIARPILGLINGDAFINIPSYGEEIKTDGEGVFAKEIKKEMESRLKEDVSARLKREFGKNCTADVEVNVTKAGEVIGVERIVVYGDEIDLYTKARLREVYGAEVIEYDKFEKTPEKSE